MLFVFIFLEVYPLLKGASVLDENTYPIKSDVVSIGVDEYQEIAYVVYKNGLIEFISILDGEILESYDIEGINGTFISSVYKDNDRLIVGTGNGKAVIVSINFSVTYEGEIRTVSPLIEEDEVVEIGDNQYALILVTSKTSDDTSVTAAVTEDGRIIIKSTEVSSTLFGGEEIKESTNDITNLIIHPQKKDC